jgi:hypothetical protein
VSLTNSTTHRPSHPIHISQTVPLNNASIELSHYDPLIVVHRILDLLAIKKYPRIPVAGLLRLDLGLVRAVNEVFELRLLGFGETNVGFEFGDAHDVLGLFALCADGLGWYGDLRRFGVRVGCWLSRLERRGGVVSELWEGLGCGGGNVNVGRAVMSAGTLVREEVN